MEYGVETFVLVLLVLGTLLLLIGLVLNLKSSDSEKSQANSDFQQPVVQQPVVQQPVVQQPVVQQPDPPRPPQEKAPSEISRPVKVRDRDHLEVDVYSRNIEFFKKQVYLYCDHEKNNIYTGSNQSKSFENNEISSVKRVGLGTLSYDGSDFSFHHQSREYSFRIIDLDHIALYPNCLVLVSQKDVPTALLFMDETDSIRKLLDVFKAK